jgi:hypothetical protein
MPYHDVPILMSPCPHFAPRVPLDGVPDAPGNLLVLPKGRNEARRGVRNRAIYTTVRMLENTSRTATSCHILRSATGRPRRKMRSVSRTGDPGSEVSVGLFSDSKTSWQYSSQNCHFETRVLFTMSKERARIRAQDGGLADGRIRGTSMSTSRSTSMSRTQDDDVRLTHWLDGRRGFRDSIWTKSSFLWQLDRGSCRSSW